jgi:AcrR family transcriptional regulator
MSRNRQQLTVDRLVDAGLRVADRDGVGGLTTTAVAVELGVTQPALYKHLSGLGELQAAVTARALVELTAALEEAAGADDGPTDLRAVARAWREFARTRPGAHAMASGSVDADHSEATRGVIDVFRGVVAAYGTTGADAVHSARAVRAAVHGFVLLESEGHFVRPEAVDASFERLLDLLDLALRD